MHVTVFSLVVYLVVIFVLSFCWGAWTIAELKDRQIRRLKKRFLDMRLKHIYWNWERKER